MNSPGPKYLGFEWDVINSVQVGVSSGLRHVTAFSNAIKNDVQTVQPVTSNALANREHLPKIFRLHTTSNEIMTIIGLHTTESVL